MKRYLFAICAVLACAWATNEARAFGDSPTLAKIKERGEIVFAYRAGSPPFSFMGTQGEPQGYSIDLCKEVAEGMRKALGRPDLRVRWIPVDSVQRFQVTETGLAHMVCGTTTVTAERSKLVDFSMTTFVTGARVLVRADSPAEKLEDIVAGSVGVMKNTTTERIIKAQILTKNLPLKLVYVKDQKEAVQKLRSRRIAAFANDYILLEILAQGSGGQFRVAGDLMSYEPYAFIVPRNDSGFRYLVNERLMFLFRTRRILNIYNTWFKGLEKAVPSIFAYLIALQGVPER